VGGITAKLEQRFCIYKTSYNIWKSSCPKNDNEFC